MTRVVVAAMALLLSASVAGAAGDRCKVTDPTGTPLNVRASPNGKIIGTLANGTLVSVAGYGEDANGKSWAQVKNYGTGKLIGWVFREFISCF
jgi:uncharacterized protein YraI